VAAADAHKHGTELPVVADARAALHTLGERLRGSRVSPAYSELVGAEKRKWDRTVDLVSQRSGAALPGQPEIIAAVHAASDPRDVLVQAAGSLPGDLHKLWRVRDPLGYHVEYAFSTMGYEIAGGLGVKRGLEALGDDRDVIVMVGDGSYLMLHSELATAVAEQIKIVVVLVQNEGYASIGNLSESVGSQRFGTRYRYLDKDSANFETGELLRSVDLAANARSYGIDVVEIKPGPSAVDDLEVAVAAAKRSQASTLIQIHSDPLVGAPEGEGWWDVPVAQVSELQTTRQAYDRYKQQVLSQRPLLGQRPSEAAGPPDGSGGG
jgi:3D-(3,5/4)-trihydroxycyclohexane-1,2-dione acylhydrolase (decyclizing)